MVTRHHLHRFVDKARVRDALDAAQRCTSAPIHVSIAPYFWGSVLRTAERAFRKHGLARAPKRNAVLFFVVPARQEFALYGDRGAHEALGQPTWDSLAALLEERFARGDATTALVSGIEAVARALAPHFPPQGADAHGDDPVESAGTG